MSYAFDNVDKGFRGIGLTGVNPEAREARKPFLHRYGRAMAIVSLAGFASGLAASHPEMLQDIEFLIKPRKPDRIVVVDNGPDYSSKLEQLGVRYSG